jgi:dTMP kinase
VNRIHHFPGFLIAIEGIDGSGKTTQSHFIQSALQKVLQPKKIAVIRTKEPTTGHWGQVLRDSALTGRLSLDEEVEAFIKDRKEHVETLINPALKDGHIVIADRYYFSSAAYQGARGIPPEEIIRRNEEFAPEPDLLVILDVEPKIGLQRIRTRGDRANHFEKTGTLKKAREIFLNIKKNYLYKLDATKKPEEIRDLILARFSEIFNERILHSSVLREKVGVTMSLFGDDE